MIFAAHPLPDESSVQAARAALEVAARAQPGELLMLALSGGASALVAAPVGAVTLADKIAISAALMRAELRSRARMSMQRQRGALLP